MTTPSTGYRSILCSGASLAKRRQAFAASICFYCCSSLIAALSKVDIAAQTKAGRLSDGN